MTTLSKFLDYALAAFVSVLFSVTAYGAIGDATADYNDGSAVMPVIRLSLFAVILVFTFLGSAHILQRLSSRS